MEGGSNPAPVGDIINVHYNFVVAKPLVWIMDLYVLKESVPIENRFVEYVLITFLLFDGCTIVQYTNFQI